jgi:hypothetical protein
MSPIARSFLRFLAAIPLVASLALAGGCAATPFRTPVKPPQGGLFNHYKAPLTTNFSGNPAGPGVRVASQSHTSYFHDVFLTGLNFAWDQNAVRNIARDAGMSEVHYADYEVLNILGIYAKFTVHVYGN